MKQEDVYGGKDLCAGLSYLFLEAFLLFSKAQILKLCNNP